MKAFTYERVQNPRLKRSRRSFEHPGRKVHFRRAPICST